MIYEMVCISRFNKLRFWSAYEKRRYMSAFILRYIFEIDVADKGTHLNNLNILQ